MTDSTADVATLRVVEIFGPTIQGEGRYAGVPTIFVRLGGCDFRCTWCDSLFAVDPLFRGAWRTMTHMEIFEEVLEKARYQSIMVCLSGGNPALQSCEGLIAMLRERGQIVTMETQGTAARAWFKHLSLLTLSPKPPSAGMDCDRRMLRACIDVGPPDVVMKVPILTEEDYDWARKLHRDFSDVEWYLSVVNDELDAHADQVMQRTVILARYQWLCELVLHDRWNAVRVLPQLHVLMWGNERGR